MKKLLLVVITVLILTAPSWNEGGTKPDSQAGDTNSCLTVNNSFIAGEQLRYKVGYKWYGLNFNAGEVLFTVKNARIMKRSAYHMTAIGKTYRTYDWFFKVRDRFETFVDKETLLPLKFIRDVDEGGYLIYENITFDHANNEATEIKDYKKPKTYKIPDCTQDVLSIIYMARCIDFSNTAINDTIPITLFLDEEVWPLYIRYLGKSIIKTKLGKFRCVKFKPLTIDGTIFTGGEDMVIYATDDDNHLPLLVETPIVVGKIKAELYSYSGLKHPLTSKIED
ncbi:MAG: DUF3108 domain-containing protein [Bacteroidetes bacterium]|nr:DUF3108 domain-containing protein [Bacteroidota bacterium]